MRLFDWMMAALFPLMLSLSISPARAQADARAEIIRQALAQMDSKDPLERENATDTNLASDDPRIRSYSFEKAMHSDDRRMRQAALVYLVENQPNWVIDMTITESSLKSIRDDARQQFSRLFSYPMSIRRFDKKTGKLEVYFDNPFNGQGLGQVAQDGISIITNNFAGSCKLQFGGENGGFLLGALTCGSQSFPAKSALQ